MAEEQQKNTAEKDEKDEKPGEKTEKKDLSKVFETKGMSYMGNIGPGVPVSDSPEFIRKEEGIECVIDLAPPPLGFLGKLAAFMERDKVKFDEDLLGTRPAKLFVTSEGLYVCEMDLNEKQGDKFAKNIHYLAYSDISEAGIGQGKAVPTFFLKTASGFNFDRPYDRNRFGKELGDLLPTLRSRAKARIAVKPQASSPQASAPKPAAAGAKAGAEDTTAAPVSEKNRLSEELAVGSGGKAAKKVADKKSRGGVFMKVFLERFCAFSPFGMALLFLTFIVLVWALGGGSTTGRLASSAVFALGLAVSGVRIAVFTDRSQPALSLVLDLVAPASIFFGGVFLSVVF